MGNWTVLSSRVGEGVLGAVVMIKLPSEMNAAQKELNLPTMKLHLCSNKPFKEQIHRKYKIYCQREGVMNKIGVLQTCEIVGNLSRAFEYCVQLAGDLMETF